MKIGYIGLGALGGQLARRFLSAHELCVWDLNANAATAFAEAGAKVAPSAAALASESDVILLCLPRSSDVRELIFGPGGLAEGLSAGKVVIDQTSGVPEETREIAELLARQDVGMIDAAVSASPSIVASGGATLMVSGPDDVVEKSLPALRAITETIFRCGTRVGDGQAMKMVNNAMNAACRLGTLEIAALGVKAGLSLAYLSEFLNREPARNQTTLKMLPALVEGKESTNFALSLMLKDVNQAVSLGLTRSVPMPIMNITRGLLQIGLNTIGDRARLEDMVGLVESMAATKLAQARETTKPDVAGSRDALPAIEDVLINSLECLGRAVTYECVSAGLKYGLKLDDIALVVNRGSGWSDASRTLLPALASGKSESGAAIDSYLGHLKACSSLASRVGAPTLIPNVVLGIFEQAKNQLGGSSSVEQLARMYEETAGVKMRRQE
jgi:3-hydroxyisobutyrate dehydrogenase